MKYITKGMYIHRGKGINYWPELGGWMVDRFFCRFFTMLYSIDKTKC